MTTMTLFATYRISTKELSGQGHRLGKNGHLRAIDNSHRGHIKEGRVPFHGSALHVLEDSDRFSLPSFYSLAPLFLT